MKCDDCCKIVDDDICCYHCNSESVCVDKCEEYLMHKKISDCHKYREGMPIIEL